MAEMYAGIDLGTTFTAAAVARAEGAPEMVSLGTSGASIPSVVYLREDGSVATGAAALQRAVSEPERVTREFKRRVGDPAPIFLAGTPMAAHLVLGRLLRWVVDRIEERTGERLTNTVITHPANWGDYRRDFLRQAVEWAEVDPWLPLTEPEAAAIHYATRERVDPGQTVAVYDLGGGTFDAAVLRRTDEGFELLGEPHGIESLGGIDLDQAILNHVTSHLRDEIAALEHDDPAVRSSLQRLRAECETAKIALSSETDTTIPIILPGIHRSVRLTRGEFEDLVRHTLGDTITSLQRALASAGVEPEDLAKVLLVGGSSRIPLVAQMVTETLGRPVAVDADPKHAIALGAAIHARNPATARTAPTAPPPPAGEPEPEPQPEPASDPDPRPEREPRPEPPQEPAPAPEPEPRPQPAPQTEPEPEPRPQPGGAGPPSGSSEPSRKRRPLLVGLAITTVAALALIGGLALFGGGDDGAGAGSDATSGTATPTTVRSPEEDPIGVVAVPEGQPIHISAIQAISEPLFSLGADQVRGMELAIGDFVDAFPDGVVARFGVDFQVVDDLCTEESGIAAAESIVEDEAVVAVIGTTCSGSAIGALPILSEAGLVTISGSASSPELTSDLNGNAGPFSVPGYFRTVQNDLFQGQAVAQFAFDELGVRRAAAIHDGDTYTDSLATAFADHFAGLGGEITLYTQVTPGETDMRPVLEEIAATQPDMIFFPILQPEGDFVVTQARTIAGLDGVVLFAADGLLTIDFLSNNATAGMFFSGPDLRFEGSGLTGVTYPALLSTYRNRFGEPPTSPFHAYAYDATMLLLTAIERTAVEQDGQLLIGRQALRDFLSGVRNVPGVTGILTCDRFGDCGAQAIAVVRHDDPGRPSATFDNVVFSRAGR